MSRRRGSKYDALTAWLQELDRDSVRLTFSELDRIVPLPPCVYRDRPSWGNCRTESASNFVRGWLNAGFEVRDVSLTGQWVEFARCGVSSPGFVPATGGSKARQIANSPKVSRVSAKRLQNKPVPTSIAEEILMTVPPNLTELENDKFLMVRLNKYNSDIVEACIARDPAYQSKGAALMEQYFRIGNYSAQAYYRIVSCIAAENSTRTSTESMSALAEYCADPDNRFLDRLRAGEPELVDDMIRHLIGQGFRRDKSLASKVCRYLNDWLYGSCDYTINDSVVRTILPYYLAYYGVDKALWAHEDFEHLSYTGFYRIFRALQARVPELDNHQLDHLIWYAYKNDSIRTEIAIALGKVLSQ